MDVILYFIAFPRILLIGNIELSSFSHLLEIMQAWKIQEFQNAGTVMTHLLDFTLCL
jgi:hypothetical protein